MKGTRVRHFQRPCKQGTSREEGYSIQILSQSLPRLLRNRPRSSLRRERRTNPSANPVTVTTKPVGTHAPAMQTRGELYRR